MKDKLYRLTFKYQKYSGEVILETRDVISTALGKAKSEVKKNASRNIEFLNVQKFDVVKYRIKALIKNTQIGNVKEYSFDYFAHPGLLEGEIQTVIFAFADTRAADAEILETTIPQYQI